MAHSTPQNLPSACPGRPARFLRKTRRTSLAQAGRRLRSGRKQSMTTSSVEDLEWWQLPQPTSEELRLSGGLLVEDWPHARHVARLSLELFTATQPLHQLDADSQHLLERAAFLHNTGMMIQARRHHKHSYRLIKDTPLPD